MFMSNIYTVVDPNRVLGHSNSNSEIVMGDAFRFAWDTLYNPNIISSYSSYMKELAGYNRSYSMYLRILLTHQNFATSSKVSLSYLNE